MSKALKTLVIGHLRGSVIPFTLPFEKGKKLTVIYGENATGKTTICDAFEFLADGRVGSLEDRGLGSTNRYWPSIGKSLADVTVELETGTSKCTGTVKERKVVVTPSDARPRVEILRRSQLQRLVEAPPAKKYEEISRFVDVTHIEASEAALRTLIRDLKGNRDMAVTRIQENEEAIQQFWESAGKPESDLIKWAEQQSTQDASLSAAQQEAIAALRAAYQQIANYPERTTVAGREQESVRKKAAAAELVLQQLVAEADEGIAELVDILEAAESFLAKDPRPATCPLCESAEKIEELGPRVSNRLEQLNAVQEAKRAAQAAKQSMAAAERKLVALEAEFARDAEAIAAITTTFAWPSSVRVPKQPCPKSLVQLPAWLKSTVELPMEWKNVEASLDSQNQFIKTLKRVFTTYRTNVRAQEELDRLLPRLESALDAVAGERHEFTDGVLRRIASKASELYEVVHPGEGLSKIILQLDESRRASLDIETSFGELTNTPPQAYLSQSHLDTLGLCFFLALASLGEPAETILVLDDILASVDEPHVERLIKMLYAEATNFRHCIITTHYRPWKEKLRWGWLQNGECQFVELNKWTIDEGLRLERSVPDVQRLRTLLAETPPDPQLVCSKAGVILEAGLDFLTLLYECRVPRKADQRYTLGDLLPAINKKLRDSLKVDVRSARDSQGAPSYETTNLGPILDELTRIAQARNVFGAHFNMLSFELLEDDAIGFGQQVLALMDALTCSQTGWPKNDNSGSYWATAGETRRLHPLQQPK